MRSFATAIIGLLCASPLLAAEAKLSAPPKAPACCFILLDASQTEAGHSIEWRCSDPQVVLFLHASKRQAVAFCPRVGPVTFTVMALDKREYDQAEATIEITGDEPPPTPDHPSPPEPDPGPPPAPTPGPGPAPFPELDIGGDVTRKAKEVQADPGDIDHLIERLEELKGDFTSGKIDPKKPIQLSAGLNAVQAKLPKDVQKRWLPGFGRWWTGVLKGLWDQGLLNDAARWIYILDVTITGLKVLL